MRMPHSMAWAALIRSPVERARLLAAARTVTVAASGADAKGERDLLLARAFAHPRDARIRFVEDVHKYFLDGAQLPLSVTGLYTQYFEEFDADAVLRINFARWQRADSSNQKYFRMLAACGELGIPEAVQKSAIKLAWKLNGERQSGLGTALHRVIELTLNEEIIPPYGGKEEDDDDDSDSSGDENDDPRDIILAELTGATFNLSEESAGVVMAHLQQEPLVGEGGREVAPLRTDVCEYQYFLNWWEDNAHLTPIRTEWSLWCSDLQLAGQLDCLMLDLTTGAFVLVDWKRSKVMEKTAFRDRRGSPPCDGVVDTNYGHYLIQQNIYAGMLSRHYGVEVARMVLLQLHPDQEGYVEHEVPFMRDVTAAIFEQRLADVAKAAAIVEG